MSFKQVYKINNTIYFNYVVNKKTTDLLLNIVDGLTNEYSEYDLVIDSPGGSVLDGLTIYNAISNSQHIINTIASGIVYGSAMLIFLAGKKRLTTQHCKLHLGEISSVNKETSYIKMVADFEYLTKLKENVDSIILRHTKLTKEQLSEFTKCESFIDSQEAINYGFTTKN